MCNDNLHQDKCLKHQLTMDVVFFFVHTLGAGSTVTIFSVFGTVMLIIVTAVFLPLLYFLKLELLGK